MKKLYMAVALAGALSAPTLQAAMQITPTRDLVNYSSGSGGEFRAAPNAALGSLVQWGNYVDSSTIGTSIVGNTRTPSFQTFCLEAGEYFNPGSTYDVVLNNGAVYGGGGAVNGYDALSVGTAYLYSQFAKGTLTGYNYTYGATRVVSAGELQQAIWSLEGEGGILSANMQTILTTGLGVGGAGNINWTADAAPWAYGVGVMNLWTPGHIGQQGFQHQDMLTMVPEPTTMIAGALLLLPFGVSTLRRMRKTS